MIPAHDNSGTAEPVYEGGDLTDPGPSLRDKIAIEAMRGDWSAQGVECGTFDSDMSFARLFARAELYYRMADAVLAARKVKA